MKSINLNSISEKELLHYEVLRRELLLSKESITRRDLFKYADNDVKEFILAFKLSIYISILLLYLLLLDGIVW